MEDAELWENARKYVELVGKVPQSFSSTVRVLRSNQTKNIEEGRLGFSSESKFQFGRILKSKTVLAPFFYASKALYPEKVADDCNVTGQRIMELYNPIQAANMLTVIFYFRRLKKLCQPEPWAWIEKRVQEFMDIGVLLGRLVPTIGITDPLIVSAMRHLSLGLFILRDNKVFQSYKLHLKKKKKQFDVDEEINLFGSSHIHTGALLLQHMGFGIEYANSYCRALLTNPKDKLAPEPSRIRLISLYIEALYSGVEPPALADESEYDIKEQSIDAIIEEAERIREEGSKLPWILKTKDDLEGAAAAKLIAETEDDDSDTAI